MTLPRVIPCLLLHQGALVKTTRFEEPRYIGDPVNVLSIFNSFAVDEIMLLDIRATVEDRPPPFDLLAQLAEECFIPLAYGGGVRDVAQVERILEIGLEKVVITTAAVHSPELINDAARTFGSQAIVAGIDVACVDGEYVVTTRSGTQRLSVDPSRHARHLVELGAGEILLTAIDREGTMQGYDLELTRAVASAVNVPVVAHGGAGKRSELAAPVTLAGASAVAAGSLFVYQGPQRGVLINYPSRAQLGRMFQVDEEANDR
jgi:cyclase